MQVFPSFTALASMLGSLIITVPLMPNVLGEIGDDSEMNRWRVAKKEGIPVEYLRFWISGAHIFRWRG